jgi:HPt (histidine-containing phosphotransfer) domain-containing protein
MAGTSPPFEPSAGPHEPAAAGLDPQALSRLRELDPDGRHGVVRRVLQAFEGSLSRMCTVLHAQAGTDTPEPSVISGIAHTLKSSSASVGALALARTCAEVERAIREQPGCELTPEIAKLLVDSQTALAAVRDMLRT